MTTVQDAVDELGRVQTASDELDHRRLQAVAAARRAGLSWEDIGRSLRMARQSAWERYASLMEDRASDTAGEALTEDAAMALSREALAAVRRDRTPRTATQR